MTTEYQAVQLPDTPGVVEWEIGPRGKKRVRLRAVVASLQVDEADQVTVSLMRTGQTTLLTASGEMETGSINTVVFGIGVQDVNKPGRVAAAAALITHGPLHDIWLSENYRVNIAALVADITVQTIGCWLDYE